ncbi:unnamed protein product [Lasius platythorax]|uniref:Fatty acid desaturase domain-containing protein n=1 Tax=Lasius platythorax TaxID=488582 RepID=A0AAV2NZG4_9HYME
MRIILMLLQASAFQDDIYVWVRDHRAHHKYTDTDADPYKARREFFFSHIGWLMVRKHPDVISKGATVNMSDVEQDPIVMFQRIWYIYLMALGCFIVPMLVAMWAWDECLWHAWHMAVARYAVNVNGAWAVNSAAHIWGVKPFDKSITPVENPTVSFLALGEGWHNYHHVFPWDYKAAELPYYFSVTTAFIDFFAYLGLAYDLKTASPDIVKKRALRNSEMSY